MHLELGCHLGLRQVSQEIALSYSLTPDTTGYTTLHPMLPDTAHNTIASPDAPLIHSTFRARVPLKYDSYLFPAISPTWKEGTLGQNDWVIMGAK